MILHLEVVAEDEAVQDLQPGTFHKLGWQEVDREIILMEMLSSLLLQHLLGVTLRLAIDRPSVWSLYHGNDLR